MRLRDLLDLPDLRLRLLCGPPESLDRPVRRVCTTDLPDPSRYLTGGEVVLSGLMWRGGPADSEPFAARLAGCGVTALGAGEAALGAVPADLVSACRRHGLALFGVPVDVAFQEITDAVHASDWSDRASGLATLLGRHRGVVSALGRGARPADLLPAAATELGVDCWVRTATGHLVAGTGPLPEPVAGPLARAFLTAARLPHQVDAAGRRYLLLGVPGQPGHRLTAWCLAVAAPDGTGLDRDRRPEVPLAEAADELQSLVTLARAGQEEGLRVERRVAERLAQLLSGPADPAELRAAAQSCRLDPGAALRVVAARLAGVPRGVVRVPGVRGGVVVPLVPRAAAPPRAASAGAGTAPGAAAVAVLAVPPGGAASLVAGLRAGADALAPGLAGALLALGVSDPVPGAVGLPGATEQARHAHQVAARRPGPATVVASAEVASHVLLLAGLGAAERQAFRDRLLGPLTEYDRGHGADLVHTLDTFLHCSGSWQQCAQALHVHVNTLRYRLARVEALTGRDLGRFEDRVDFFLALRLPAG